jgi:hypothetical protein
METVHIRADQDQTARGLLEEQVLAGINSGESVPMTARDWEEIRAEVRARVEARKTQ